MSDKLEQTKEQKLAELATTVADYESQAAAYMNAASKVKEEIRELLDDHGTIPAGNFSVTWKRPNRKFDEASFRAAHPFNKEPEYYTLAVNASAVPGNIKDTYMVPGEGDGTVSVK